jgi:uncharacterized protein (DUF1786 family)
MGLKMKILTVDIGTGTQDIFLFDSRLDIENGYKLIMPSPTMSVFRRIKEATQRSQAILLSGVIMGGGPAQWAAEAHKNADLQVFATPEAACSFNDDLDAVRDMGITVLSEDEADALPADVCRIELRDFNFSSIRNAFRQFDVTLDGLTAVAVAVFDHGNAPPGVSDRKFRFDYLDERIRQCNRLSAFAYRAQEIPAIMTRMAAVANSAQNINAPLVVMDTAPAAVLGATFDPRVKIKDEVIIANVGNFHTLAFRLGSDGIEGVFEHHTGLLDREKLERYLRALADGTLTREEVFADQGHGALIYGSAKLNIDGEDFGVAVTGPRRKMMHASKLRPYFCAPFGDMMITGCFGLLSAVGDLIPETKDEIISLLSSSGESGVPPWELLD